MPPDEASALRDIIVACSDISALVAALDESSFLADSVSIAAMKYHLIILGEAVKRLPADFRAQHPEMRWSAMAGLRDVLIHAYDRIDDRQVWDIATASVPPVLVYVRELTEQ